MSVVNKMLQDLEARKSQPDEIQADYQPPQKQQPKWLIWTLLIIALFAITFALLDFKQILPSSDGQNNLGSAQNSPQKMTKKVMVMAQDEPAQPLNPADTLAAIDEPIRSTAKTSKVNSVNKINPNSEPVVAQKQPLVAEPVQIEQPANTPVTMPSTVASQAKVIPQKQPSFTMSGSTKANQSTSLKQRIAESLNSNDLETAQSLLSELLIDEPDNLKARKKLASLYFSQGNYAQTKQLLVRGIDLDPLQTDLILMLARLYAVQDETEQAMMVMKDVKPSVNNQIEFLAYRAALAQQLKQPHISKADYLSLAGIDATSAKWWLGLAIAQDQLGEINNAIKAYEKAYSLGQLDDSVDEFIQQRISVLVGTQ